ncbi:hypothetical protein COL10_03455 [Bacillus cereus]|uniref:hypothetical protein n=1 Tax=Bacillus cereus TaxID=1396 RepID=UPI000BECECCB|nr:hypothetical protein [Bacillus cereus]PEF92563.1 hypothetical protein CON46_11355 [Bacillus cereus]PFD76450.1 hypothetical protein CN301_05375 [Bacillus cereus]PFV13686.1 hypothetical protein COL10_03455 [Bacillus cereus]PGV45704.1 hypothetical protein COD74_11020 [Bacillus cereus]
MKDEREFKSFLVLENLSYTRQSNEFCIPEESLDFEGEKVIVKKHSDYERKEFSDYEFLWETKREIISEVLDENSGEIHYKKNYINKVAQISVWIYRDLPIWIVFIKGATANKVIHLLNNYFPECELSRVTFKDDFFNLLLNSSNQIYSLQTTMKSASTEQEFSISGYLDRSNYSITDGYITELQIEAPAVGIRAKLYYTGRVALYNTPHRRQVDEFIQMLGIIMIESQSLRGDY